MDQNSVSEIPLHIVLTFLAVVVTSLSFLFYALKVASPGKKDFTPTVVMTFLAAVMFITALLAFTGFLSDFHSVVPKLPVILFIEILIIAFLFYSPKTREYIAKMPITTLTHIHIIRVPVEIVLWWLFKEGIIDPILTFEGNNYDIIAGITAPFAGLFLVGLRSKSKFSAIIWNVASLVLLINIIAHAILCTPYTFQSLCFETPNQIIFTFPFVWLPTIIVPIVMFCHIASIYQLITTKDTGFN